MLVLAALQYVLTEEKWMPWWLSEPPRKKYNIYLYCPGGTNDVTLIGLKNVLWVNYTGESS